MKFLLSVFAIRFLIEMVSNKKTAVHTKDSGERAKKILHPAEFELR